MIGSPLCDDSPAALALDPAAFLCVRRPHFVTAAATSSRPRPVWSDLSFYPFRHGNSHFWRNVSFFPSLHPLPGNKTFGAIRGPKVAGLFAGITKPDLRQCRCL